MREPTKHGTAIPNRRVQSRLFISAHAIYLFYFPFHSVSFLADKEMWACYKKVNGIIFS